MQQPFTNSEAVKRCMWMPEGQPSGQIRYGPKPPYATGNSYKRERPFSAPSRHISADIYGDRWKGPRYQEPKIPVPRNYNVTLHHRYDETEFSRNAPYASRKVFSDSIFRNGDARGSIPLPPYNPLNDPHLSEYFERRFGAIQASAIKRKLMGRPASASGYLSSRRGTGEKKRKKDGDVLYKVAVVTGDKKNAGTDAKVFVTLKGLKGKISKTRLTKKAGSVSSGKKVAFRFAKGSTHVFKIRGPELGDLKSVIIEHDGTKAEEAWFLQEVEVVHVKKKKSWSFICNQWLSLHHGDQHTTRELFPHIGSKTDYEIVTVTGDKQNASTNANVFITVYGKTGTTQKIPLKDYTQSTFRQNSSDTFKVRTNCVGPLRKIRIEHDNTGLGSGWYLERVVITDLEHPKWKYYFPCGQWLARDEGDGSICRYLIGSRDPFAIRKDSLYKIQVFTGDKKGAGTDANVSIILFGENGDSGEKKLDNNKNNFERNMKDEFSIKCPCLGRLERIRIGHDNSGFGPGWFLDKIIIDDCDNNIVYTFPCSRWFSKSEDDGLIWRDLVAGLGPRESYSGIPYTITVQTGDEPNAGTDARVFIILFGGKNKSESSGKIWLGEGNFQRGRSEIFHVDIGTLLSPLEKIEIGHDNSGVGPGWYLEQVIIYCPVTGIEQVFPCRKWFAVDSGDKLIHRTLYEQTAVRKKKEKRIRWLVWVYTSDISMAGTDSNVGFCVYGLKGKSEEIMLRNKSDEFEQGNIDTFKIDIADVGKIYKVRIYHDNKGLASGWHLNKVEMENPVTKERYMFNCDRWLARSEDDHETVRELPADGPLVKSPLPVVKYTVEVYTGKKSRAGTDANVFMTIFGELGDTGKRWLKDSKTNINKFEKGQCDIFQMEAVTLEKISKIQVGHDGAGIGAGWYLEKVIVKREDNAKFNTEFECNTWLAEDEETGSTVREFTASGSQLLHTTTYNVYVKTGDERYAGTDANVNLTIFGAKGDTGNLHLRNSESHSNKFERGQTDHFILESTDIGKIKRIKIGHDSGKPGSGWLLDEVRIDVPSRGEQYVFACHRWLDKSEGDGKTEIELEPSFKEDIEKGIPYEVTVWTGDKRGAGTDANVFVQMYGRDGKTEQIDLRNRSDNFERNKIEKFKITEKDVGQLIKIRIGHDGTGFGDGWFLDKLLIQRKPRPGTVKRRGKRSAPSPSERRQSILSTLSHDNEDMDSDGSSSSSSPTPRRRRSLKRKPDLKTVEEEEEEETYDGTETEDYWFFVNKWFAKDEDDKQIVRELTPTDKDGNPIKGGLKELEYTVKVYTGKESGAGTDANVFVNLYGSITDSGERQLKEEINGTRNKFETGQCDTFKVRAVELGKLVKLRVRHDDSGFGAAWFLDRIEVEDPKSKSTYYFICQRWLAKGEDDGQICRELVPYDKALVSKLNRKDSVKSDLALETKAFMTTYHIKVVTGKVFGGGTDANVFIRLFGDKDNTEKLPLKSSMTHKNKFETGQTDEFIIEVVNIGELKKVNISHDDSGLFGADWFLEKVVIDAPSLGRSWTFPCSRWLAKNKDDGKLERDLFPQELETEEYEKCIPYEIKTYTSDKSGAGTTADVYIQLYGKELCTAQKSLCGSKNERSGKFDKGKCDVLVLELEDIGDILKIRIGHDNGGMFPGWHLSRLEIRKLHESGKGSVTYTFPCDRWLARDEDDRAIERELVPEKIFKEVLDRDGQVKQKEIKVKNQLKSKVYTVNVKTGNVKGAGTDANVFINIHGDKGNTGERKLAKSETHRDKFEKDQMDIFKLEARDLGNIYKLKINHDNSNFGPAWYLDYVEIIDVSDNNKQYMFHCERWLAKNKEDGKIERSLYVKGYEGEMGSSTGTLKSTKYGGSMVSLDSQSDKFSKSPRMTRKALSQAEESSYDGPVITYNVKVWTGDGEDMGTDSNVWVTIIGPKDRHTGRQFLEFAQKDKFDPGSVKVFSFDAADVGEVKKIEVGHDGTAPGSGWFLKEISVDVPTKGKHYTFLCKTWLARDKYDGKTVRVFRLDEGLSTVKSYRPMVSYDCTIFTSDVSEAGTDMKITVTVFGANGTSTPITLEKGSDRFERDRADLIKLEIDDIAPLKKIRVETDGKGSRPQWHLDHIEMVNQDTGQMTRFDCNDWFGKKKGEGKLVRDIAAKERGKEVIKKTSYRVNVKTSDVSGAGTDANVYVIFFGSNGDSGELHLKKSETFKDPFENNQLDVFTFNDMLSLGELSKCRVWHDNKGFGAAWHLNYIELEDLTTNKKYMFHCDRWLSKSEDDKQILRELTCASAAKPLTPGSKDETTYEIEVITDDKEKGGTIHNGWLIIKGRKRSTQYIMKNSAKNPVLRRAHTDHFTKVCKPLGKIEEVVVGASEREDKPLQDLEGKEAKWYCLKISVTDTSTGDKYVFPCKSWISIGVTPFKGGKTLELRDVEQSQVSIVRNLASVKYQVVVYTGDVFGAGTNANVSLTLYGENGDTGKRPLEQKWRDLFERNQIDKFEIECLDLGELSKVKIEHDNANFRPGWFLDKIEIINLATNLKTTFPCGQWLDKNKEDKAICRELMAIE